MRAATFAEVLEDRLGADFEPASWARPSFVTPPLPPFNSRPIPFSSTPYASINPGGARMPGVAGHFGAAVPKRRQGVVLTARQRRAQDTLNALGAALDETMTRSELRRAFRTLARRYHPDRHPGSTSSEQAQFARTFATMIDEYRLLEAALR